MNMTAAFAIDHPLPPGDHALTVTSTFDGTAQPYRLFIPRAARHRDPLPLVVVLHGKGVDQNAWFDLTPVKEVAELHGCVVAAPYGRGNWFYRGPGEQDVLDTIEDAGRFAPVDPTRVYLMGHSMGGWGAWWIGLRHPDRFVTIVPMAGLTPVELLPNAQYLQPYIIHDTGDPIVPVEQSRTAAHTLVELGIPFHYREETGYGHASKMIGDNLDRVFTWMLTLKPVMQPHRVRFVTRSPSAGKAYWLGVLSTDQFPRLATVDAFVNTSSTLVLSMTNVHSLAIDLEKLPAAHSGVISATINGTAVDIPSSGTWAILTKKSDSSLYTVDHASELEDYRSPTIGEVAVDYEGEKRIPELAKRMGEHVRRETGADVFLAADDMFRIPKGSLTEDGVLDAYVQADWRLARFRCRGSVLQAAVSGPESLLSTVRMGTFYVVGGPTPPEKEAVVVAPVPVAAVFGTDYELLPEVVPEYLLRAARSSEVFP